MCVLLVPWLGEGKVLFKLELGEQLLCPVLVCMTCVLSKYGSFLPTGDGCHMLATDCQVEAG